MPPRDVAVLVDVSKSVPGQDWKDVDRHTVKRLITGLKGSHYRSKWELEAEPFFEEGMPLMKVGNSLFILKFGDYETARSDILVKNPEPMTTFPQAIDRYFGDHYPLVSGGDFDDDKTQLNLAKALVYKHMDKNRGYYMIVVSDEDPDPEKPLNSEERALVSAWERALGDDVYPIAILSRKGSALKITLWAVGFDPERPIRGKALPCPR